VAEYTITWNGSRWTNRSTSGDPSPRADGSIAFNERTGQVVLYGGTFDQPQPFAETWVWDGASWSLWRAAEGAEYSIVVEIKEAKLFQGLPESGMRSGAKQLKNGKHPAGS